MIVDTEVITGLGGTLSRHYKNLGYTIPTIVNKHGKEVISRFATLKVKIEHLPKNSNVKVNVQCELCGTTCSTAYQKLTHPTATFSKNGTTPCNKCSNKLSTKKGSDNHNFKYGRGYTNYKYSAKRRELEFSLSPEKYKQIVETPCYYCGDSATNRHGTNGIDRRDNSKGYTFENSVPCCRSCNTAKMDSTYEEFTNKIIKIYKTLNLG